MYAREVVWCRTFVIGVSFDNFPSIAKAHVLPHTLAYYGSFKPQFQSESLLSFYCCKQVEELGYGVTIGTSLRRLFRSVYHH